MFRLSPLLLITLLAHTTETVWVNEDFWTAVSGNNVLSGGRTVSDFARIDNDNIFPALWITRTHYPEHFESFGFAFVRPEDGRVCGWFAGLLGDAVELCGGFRVLSVPEYYRGQKIFEWVRASDGEKRTVGFSSHRIARRVDPTTGNVTYGDALHAERSFLGVMQSLQGGAELVSERDEGFTERISLLKLLVDPRANEDRFRSFRQPEYGSVLPPRENEIIPGGTSIRMYVPVNVVVNEKGEHFEKKIIDGRTFFVPFNVAEKRALTLHQILHRNELSRKMRVKRRHLQVPPVA